MELGAISIMLYGFREREYILDIFETITGLRMNHAYVRPGGVAQDVPDEAIVKIREFLKMMPKKLKEYEDLLSGQPIWTERTRALGTRAVSFPLRMPEASLRSSSSDGSNRAAWISQP